MNSLLGFVLIIFEMNMSSSVLFLFGLSKWGMGVGGMDLSRITLSVSNAVQVHTAMGGTLHLPSPAVFVPLQEGMENLALDRPQFYISKCIKIIMIIIIIVYKTRQNSLNQGCRSRLPLSCG